MEEAVDEECLQPLGRLDTARRRLAASGIQRNHDVANRERRRAARRRSRLHGAVDGGARTDGSTRRPPSPGRALDLRKRQHIGRAILMPEFAVQSPDLAIVNDHQ